MVQKVFTTLYIPAVLGWRWAIPVDTKAKDRRARRCARHYGHQCWELNVLHPKMLQQQAQPRSRMWMNGGPESASCAHGPHPHTRARALSDAPMAAAEVLQRASDTGNSRNGVLSQDIRDRHPAYGDRTGYP